MLREVIGYVPLQGSSMSFLSFLRARCKKEINYKREWCLEVNCYQGCAEKCTYTRFMPPALASIQISEVCVIQAETAYIKSPPPPRPPSPSLSSLLF